MDTLYSLSDLPKLPAVYAMCGGKGKKRYAAYVGIAKSLRKRIIQHLIRKDSSVTTGTSAVALNSTYITEIVWWEHKFFYDKVALQAAELIAFDILKPILRSRGLTQERAKDLLSNESFTNEMERLFSHLPRGRLVILTLDDALSRIAILEKRISILETLLNGRDQQQI